MKNNLHKINLNNGTIKLNDNISVDSKKTGNNKYNLTFNEINYKGVRQKYSSDFELKSNDQVSKSGLLRFFDKVKENFLKGLAILSLSVITLSSCSIEGMNKNNDDVFINSNYSLNKTILKNDFFNQTEYIKGEINYINLFNDFNSNVYKEKNTAKVTINNSFKEFVNKSGNIKIDKLITYINENKGNLDDIFNIDFTIFQKGFLYEMINSEKSIENNYGDLGNRYINFFEENYGKNYDKLSYKEIIKKDILSISDFIKDSNFNGDISTSSVIYKVYKDELGEFKNDYKKINIKNLNKINNKLLEIAENTGDIQLKEQVLYSEYIKNNLLFLLTKSPKTFIEDFEKNGTTFEIGYGDNNYIDISGTFTFSPDTLVGYGNDFKEEVKTLNKKLSSSGVEIILDDTGILIAENGKVLAPLDSNSLEKYFLLNPNSEIKKILINSTLLSTYFAKNYYKETKTNDKSFFIKGIQSNVKSFQKKYNLTDNEIESLFKYGNINGGKEKINIYGVEIDLTKTFNNKYNINYDERVFLNTANFGTLIHELYHVYHLKYLNGNINSNSYNFIDSINTYPYSSNYSNDFVYKTIIQELFYKAYKGTIDKSNLENFSYYSLSTFNYFEFISELGSGYFLYPMYNDYLNDNFLDENNIYFKIIQELDKHINFKNK